MYKMILVDDETLALELLSKIISQNSDGFELTATFEHPEAAIEYIKNEHVDVIISDISMPGMSGLDFLEYIENNAPHIIFIVLSAYKNFDYVKFAMSHNAAEYLTKPINKEELRKLMQKIKSNLDKQLEDVEYNNTELICHQALIDYLLDSKASGDEFSNILNDNGIKISPSLPAAIVHVKVENIDTSITQFNYGSDRLHTALIQLFNMDKTPVLSINSTLSGMNIIFFSVENNDFADYISNKLAVFRTNCEQLLSLKVATHTTAVFNNLEDAKSSILKILNLSTSYMNENPNNDHISTVLNYIHANYQKDLSLPELANYVHLTPYHFSRLFKKVTGSTFVSYINDFRINKAKEMLTDTALTVTEIGKKSGFSNMNNFYRTFKKSTGMTPHEFRNRDGE